MTALLLLMPGTPMLFQGQEFGASTPFLYFADHQAELAAAVQRGRAEFVAQFPSLASPEAQASLPLPHDPSTFERCKLELGGTAARTHARLHRGSDRAAPRRTPPSPAARAGASTARCSGPRRSCCGSAAPDDAGERLLIVNLGADDRQSGVSRAAAGAASRDADGRCSGRASIRPTAAPGRLTSSAARGWRIPGHSAIVLSADELRSRQMAVIEQTRR